MAYIDKINKSDVDYDIQDSKAARSVDGSTASHVEEADQIHTSTGVTEVDNYFVFRTTAGDASISTGQATLVGIKGHTVQSGHTDEVINMVAYFADSGTSATINEATWRSYVSTDGSYEFSYDGSDWKLADSVVTLANYGISVSGTIAEDDAIIVQYTALVIGTLSTATPTSFVSNGFNQYDDTAGYAHVVGNNQYRIDGTYSSLGFTTTVGGTTTPVTVTDGKFTPAEDGYIYVTGGSGDILIALVWSGIRDNDPFEAYEESTVTIPTADSNSAALPTATYGMPSVGDVADELSFVDKTYTQRIGQKTYSVQNLEDVIAMGVDYLYDMTNIFYVLDTPVVYSLASSVSGGYTANDFGTELFIGTAVSVGASLYYGNNLVDKLRNLADIQTIGSGLALNGGELSASGGGGDAVYSTKTTSNARDGGAVYIGDKDATQAVKADPTTTDNHYKYFWAMPFNASYDASIVVPGEETINIGGYQGNLANGCGTHNVSIGYRSGIDNWVDAATVVGWQAATGSNSYVTAIGANSKAKAMGSTAIGYDAQCYQKGSVALGRGAYPTRVGEVCVSADSTAYGFNNTINRVIGGVYDGQDLHDAATVAQGNTLSTSAPTTSTVGVLGQLYTDTTNMHTYQCTAISGSTYTWTQRW